jgi:tetratricopeptide (TPR) repeat protein
VAKKPANSKSTGKARQAAARQEAAQNPAVTSTAKTSSAPILQRPYIPYLIIFSLCIGLYYNTTHNDYTIDDPLVSTANKFTLKGFAGIKDIMTHDALVGYFGEQGSEALSGGRYRPLSIVTFAIEDEFFGMNPRVSHTGNILLFAFTCLLLYHLLLHLFPRKKDSPFYLTVPFIAAVLFAGHPIHTEAVANIKGRDEIMGLLLVLSALYAGLKYVKTHKLIHLVWGVAVFFLALLSKENTITFMAIIPLTFFFFTKAKFKDYLLVLGTYIIPVIIYLYMRSIYTNAGLAFESNQIINNPFAYLPKDASGLLQHYATVIMTFILYFKLLIFPHPLSHDYYYNQIPIVGITDPLFIVSLVVNAGLLIYALIGLRRKSLPTYAILFYFITFSVVSNVFFTVGVLLNERLLFMSSIGFCLLLAWLLVKAGERFKLSGQIVASVLVVIMLLYSVKTISRNRAWSDNLTLVLHDVKTSPNSAKVLLSAGTQLVNLAYLNFDTMRMNGQLQHYSDLLDLNVNVASVPDTTIQKLFSEKSIEYFHRSIAIYPDWADSWLGMANASYKLHKPPAEVIEYYKKAELYCKGVYYQGWFNLGCVYIENNMPDQARESFLNAMALDPNQIATTFNLAVAYTNLNKLDSAIIYYKKSAQLKPEDAANYYRISTIYSKLNNADSTILYLNMALHYNPNAEAYYNDLSVAYSVKNMPDDVIRVSGLCLSKFPNSITALRTMADAYNKKGQPDKAHEYEIKVAQLTARKK